MITGVDLVEEQIKIAKGELLSEELKNLTIKGHAIELRVYAEDPLNNFLPDVGKIEVYNKPSGKGVRVDDAIEAGMDIPIFYDPMISKLIVHGENRSDAINKMLKAIDDYDIVGVKNTLSFCKYAINHSDFRSGLFDTRFVKLNFSDPSILNPDESSIKAGLAAIFNLEGMDKIDDSFLPSNKSNWQTNR
jgi:acetyl/propionyl-CoA carboxylase alpha subunit